MKKCINVLSDFEKKILLVTSSQSASSIALPSEPLGKPDLTPWQIKIYILEKKFDYFLKLDLKKKKTNTQRRGMMLTIHNLQERKEWSPYGKKKTRGPQPTMLLCPWNSPGKNTGMGSHSFLQGIFLNQGSNMALSHCRQILFISVTKDCYILSKITLFLFGIFLFW